MNAATEPTALPQRGTRMTRLDVFTDAALAVATVMLATSTSRPRIHAPAA